MSKLKPCPFCGKPVSLRYSSRNRAFEVYHADGDDGRNCYIIGPIMLDAVSLAGAAESWNRRFGDE